MRYFSLPDAVIISVSGAQAERYLQVRLTNDMKTLSPQRAMLAAALSPQGRTEALFTVLSGAQNSFVLFSDGGQAQTVLDALKRFVVTERIDFVDESQNTLLLHLIPDAVKNDIGALFPEPPVHAREFSRITTGSAHFISRRRSVEWGWDVLISRSQSAAFLDKLRSKEALELAPLDQKLLRLRAGVPVYPIEINSEHIFAEAGLIQAVSFTKGCYTGQEVIAKIDALGKPPRLLTHLKLSKVVTLSAGDPVITPSEQRPAGEVLSSAQDPENGTTWVFASLRSSVDYKNDRLLIGQDEASVVTSAPEPAKSE